MAVKALWTRPLSRRQARWQLVAAVGAALAGLGLYDRNTDYPGIVSVQLGGSEQRWPPADPVALESALLWDFALVVGYGLALMLLIGLARQVLYSRRTQACAVVAAWCTALAVCADVVENIALLVALAASPTWVLSIAAAAAVIKFCALAVAVPVSLGSGITVGCRLWKHHRSKGSERKVQTVEPPRVVTASTGTGSTSSRRHRSRGDLAERWVRGFEVPGISGKPVRPGQVGFAVSGGGIRSAAVTLGALQGLRSTLRSARYLVSVSGGGYTVGAMQLALQQPVAPSANGVPLPPAQGGNHRASPATVLMPGSVEEDHLRRHSSYLADGTGQWLVALGVVLRGLLFSLVLLTLTVTVAGLVMGIAYTAVPLVDLPALRSGLGVDDAPPFPRVLEGVTVALAFLAAVTTGLYLASLKAYVGRGRTSFRWFRSFQGATALFLLVAALGVGLPGLLWASVAVTSLGPGQGPGFAGGAAGTVAITYAGTLAGMLWRQRRVLGKQVQSLRERATAAGTATTGLFQRLLVTAALLLLAVLFLLVLGAVAVVSADNATEVNRGAMLDAEDFVLLAAVSLLFFAWLLLDQTWMSLHPFYRRRLSAAFAVRRGRGPDGRAEARPYDYQTERTTLSTYGARPANFPEVIFAAAANLSGQERTPPGRRAVSFTQTARWIGGPDVGYVKTADLENAVSTHVARDLTVQAAMAISGAAFASAMGRQARAFQTLFALTNARLGTWLPNPAFIAQWAKAGGDEVADWTVPSPPSIRRLNYLMREILGSYPCDDRFLFVTDGGHYENLGLVELLRRRCTTIYCIDASGDVPPLAGALADAIDLAYEELGVTITLNDQWGLVPGGGPPIDPADPLSALNGRLSRTAVIDGTVTYPAESGLPVGTTGKIVIAKALLTPDMPYPLLAHAVRAPAFPNDSTGDQWFDHTQFTAYCSLGRELARQAMVVTDGWSGGTPRPGAGASAAAASGPNGATALTSVGAPDPGNAAPG